MKPLYQRPFDLVQVLYFLVHIPTTLLIDSQSLAPSSWYPNAARELLQWCAAAKTAQHEITMRADPGSSQAHQDQQRPPGSRKPSMVWAKATYIWSLGAACGLTCTHVATTLVPILADFIFGNHATNPNWVAVAIYSPYLLLPLALAVRMAMVDYGKGGRGGSKAKRV
ncbi:expera domain-containing protein [Haematococcus lacustris]|uniref:Expera domain-containing protein n=1 Tax=Haematococcus lacustris TaxID=44745 RepID=A0A699ZVC8_HAELA|nr:expera domain-containing protein [Haematococcus lacustris]